MTTIIDREEWLKALTEAQLAQEDDQSAVTIDEFGAMMNLSRYQGHRMLDKLVEAGKAHRTQKRKRTSHGKMVWHIAYRLGT